MKLIPGLLLTLPIILSGTYALVCYDCLDEDPNCSIVDPQCSEASPAFMTNIRNMYFPNDKTNYEDVKNLPKPVCYTAKETDKNGETKVSRRCSPLGDTLTCDVIKTEAKNERQSKLISCSTCSKDLCNSASFIATSLLLIPIVFVFLILPL